MPCIPALIDHQSIAVNQANDTTSTKESIIVPITSPASMKMVARSRMKESPEDSSMKNGVFNEGR